MLCTWVDEWGEQGVDVYTGGVDQSVLVAHVDEISPFNTDPSAYDVTRYLPGADHGSVLITTRLANLEQLGRSWMLGRLSREQTEAMFRNQYKGSYGKMTPW